MRKRTNAWSMGLWPVAPLLIQVQVVYDCRLEIALSMLVGHVKACRMNMSAEGWLYSGFVLGNSRTKIKDLVDFAWPLRLRVEPLTLQRVRQAERETFERSAKLKPRAVRRGAR